MKLKPVLSAKLRSGRTAGFTLIEILLVIVIILLLAGALVVFVLPQQEGAEKNTTRLLLNGVGTALDTYRLNIGHYPSEQEGGLDALLGTLLSLKAQISQINLRITIAGNDQVAFASANPLTRIIRRKYRTLVRSCHSG